VNLITTKRGISGSKRQREILQKGRPDAHRFTRNMYWLRSDLRFQTRPNKHLYLASGLISFGVSALLTTARTCGCRPFSIQRPYPTPSQDILRNSFAASSRRKHACARVRICGRTWPSSDDVPSSTSDTPILDSRVSISRSLAWLRRHRHKRWVSRSRWNIIHSKATFSRRFELSHRLLTVGTKPRSCARMS